MKRGIDNRVLFDFHGAIKQIDSISGERRKGRKVLVVQTSRLTNEKKINN